MVLLKLLFQDDMLWQPCMQKFRHLCTTLLLQLLNLNFTAWLLIILLMWLQMRRSLIRLGPFYIKVNCDFEYKASMAKLFRDMVWHSLFWLACHIIINQGLCLRCAAWASFEYTSWYFTKCLLSGACKITGVFIRRGLDGSMTFRFWRLQVHMDSI